MRVNFIYFRNYMSAQDSKEGGKRLTSSYVSSVISVTLVLFMLGLLGLMVLDAKKISDYVKEHVQVSIFLQDNLDDKQVASFSDRIHKLPYVRSTTFISKDAALEKLKNELGEDALGMIESNPLPATIDVNIVAAYAHPDSLAGIKAELQKNKEVMEVVYQQNEVAKMNKNFRTLAMIILVFSALLIFVAVVLINNTIRLSLYSKRFLIKSMQLVGATKGFIRWPFLKKGLVQGLLAGIISMILLMVIIYFIHQKFPDLGQMSDLNIIGILFIGVISFGFILSGFSTYFAVNKYLRYPIDQMY
jgi:cell division transport system permease protein